MTQPAATRHNNNQIGKRTATMVSPAIPVLTAEPAWVPIPSKENNFLQPINTEKWSDAITALAQ
eukprot:2031683-Rhodomonas_salina.1